MNTLPILFSQPWVDRLGWTLVHFLWQGAAIAAIFAIVRRFTLKPEARYVLACIALAAMVAAPFATFLLTGPPSIAPAGPIAAVTDRVPTAILPATLPAPDFWQRVFPWMVTAWLAGVLAFSMRLIGGWFAATRLRSTAASAAPREWEQTLERLAQRLGTTRPVRLLVSAALEVPGVVGWLRPAILIPADALADLPAGYIEALLAHELAHIRRHDFLVNMLQKIAEALLFYHPALWWVSHQIRIERELCCDDLAVASSGDVLTYARALAELESLRPAHSSLAVAANGGSLVKRIRRLLAPEKESHALPGMGAASIASLLVLIGVFALAQAQQPVAQPVIHRDAIWIDTVKQGDLQIDVRGLGTLISHTSARVIIYEPQEVRLGDQGFLDLRRPVERVSPVVVTRIDPQSVNGTVAVELQIPELPESRTVGEEIDATIHNEILKNALYVGRTALAKPGREESVFKLDADGKQASHVKVRYGRTSVNAIQILSGLAPGDRIILSDTSQLSKYDRIIVE